MKLTKIAVAFIGLIFFVACSEQTTKKTPLSPQQKKVLHEVKQSKGQNLSTYISISKSDPPFKWQTERFADIRVLRYQVPGFKELPLATKHLLFYLYKAALSGRDITWDQNYKFNLIIRQSLEAVIRKYSGDRTT